ncbi:MAG: hypothetical protein HN348_21680, partial [Proteobacteria bacterium]|nr:hypothetical protein [Pseudomonadota bacterium]
MNSGRRRQVLFGLLLWCVASLCLFLGWKAFWFLCDDAYIAFRYVSNSQFGWGYTWNPPPFRPVEGYTSFLWVVLLDGTWSVLGVEPPDSANWISLVLSMGSLGLMVAMGMQVRLSDQMERWRWLLLSVMLAGTLSNRTFLAWTSSGLEAALVTFLILLWLYVGLFLPRRRHWTACMGVVAALLALARPDGLLFVAALICMICVRSARDKRQMAASLFGLMPLLFVGAHLCWRYYTYGYWLPNTYYAKHVAIWPLAGITYLAAFLVEYAFWVWLLVLGVATAHCWPKNTTWRRWALDGWTDETLVRAVVSGTVVAHFAYYTFSVGGDHFEYRIYHHLVPLLWLTLPLICDRMGWTAQRIAMVSLLMLVFGLPIPWVHWAHTKDLSEREQTYALRYKVAPHFPWVIRWYPLAFDALQEWLIGRFVGTRHQGHKVFWHYQLARFPTREEGLKITGEEYPVFAGVPVGVPAWVLPRVAIIDTQ